MTISLKLKQLNKMWYKLEISFTPSILQVAPKKLERDYYTINSIDK